MFDVDRLKEIAEHFKRQLETVELSAKAYEELSTVGVVLDMVAAGQPLWWCEKHRSIQRGGGTWCEYAQWKGYGGPPNECRMVEGWWMPTGPSPTGPSPAKPTCSHGFNKPHSVGGTTNFHYDVATVCDEWVVERGLATDKLKVSPTGKDET